MKKTLGVIGGMGPAATCDLMEKIISLTRAASDQEHIHMLADVNTAIPDRTAAILHGGPDVSVPGLHMPREAAAALKAAGVKKAGVLATDGTVRAGVYEKALVEAGIELLYPSPAMQAEVMRLIYDGVKGRSAPLESIPVGDILQDLRGQGAEKVVLACTELPIAFAALGPMEACLDATRALAFAAVRAAGAETTAPDPW